MRIGILGGSFNPVHNGHLALAEAARRELSLERVLFVPTHASPLKKASGLLPQELRVALLRAALKGRPGFRLDLCEIRRGGTSYTVDTLRQMRRRFGRRASLYFICGADAVRRLSRWKSPREVLKLCRFVAANRPGQPRVRVRPGVLGLEMPPMAVSASDVRRRIRAGGSLKGLVPPSVERELKKISGGSSFKRKKR